MPSRERKEEFCNRLREMLNSYSKILVVGADNVGSSHMQKIRADIRGKGVLLMGKNTMIRRVIRTEFEQYECLLPALEGNVGLIFTNSDLPELRDTIVNNKVGAPAKAGAIAPCDVVVPAGDTGLEPTQTAFLQALNIASRINRGQITILNDVKLFNAGDKVGASQAALLQKLKIRPFSYGLILQTIYDEGSIYSPEVLDINFDVLSSKISFAATRIAQVALSIGYPVLASVPHSMARGFKNLLSLAVATDIEFKQAEEIKNLLSMDPEELAKMVASTSTNETEKKDTPDNNTVDEEEEEEEDEEDGFSIF